MKDSDAQPSASIDRRGLLRAAAGLAAGAVTVSAAAKSPAKEHTAPSARPAARTTIVASYTKPIAETTSGKVRGYIRNGVFTFKGIPYGAPTGEAGRFQPPAKPTPWAGVRSSLHYERIYPNGYSFRDGGDNAPR
jgi:para-nitrobenzyl esterase